MKMQLDKLQLDKLKRFLAIVALILFLTVTPYLLSYFYVKGHPDLFLMEISTSSHSQVGASPSGDGAVVTDSVSTNQAVYTCVTRWSWLRGIHERFGLVEGLLFLSIGFCSHFKPSKRKQSFIKKAFFTYGIFVALWFSSLAFVSMHKLDEVLSVVVFATGVFLLSASSIAVLNKTLGSRNKVRKLRQSIFKWGFLFGVFVALWLVSVSFVPFGLAIPFVAFILAGVSVVYLVFTILSSQIKKERKK